MKTYKKIAYTIAAIKNCQKDNNTGWEEKHTKTLDSIAKELPHGSGLDGKLAFNLDKSSDEKIVIDTEFHVMNKNGYYENWIDFSIIITPSFHGIDIRFAGAFGKNQDLKEYLTDIFQDALNKEVPQYDNHMQ